MLIQIKKNSDGSHAFSNGYIIDEGWAYVPEDIIIPSTFPYVNIEIEEKFYPAVYDTVQKESLSDDGLSIKTIEETILISEAYSQLEVISMTEGEIIEIEEPLIPSQIDILEAQVTYTAMMTDTLLEV
jgi:hypothetical protein